MPIKRASATRETGRRRDKDEDEDRYAYDEDEDEPRGRRRRGRDDDEDEEREERSRSRRSRDDDDEEDDRPRRSRRRDEDDEEDEDDRPRARRSRRDEDDEDEDRPRSRRSRDEDEEDDRGRPRSSRRRRDSDDDDDEPRGRGRGRGRDDDRDEDEPRSRVKRRARDDDDDDRDRGRGRRVAASVNEGWQGADRTQSASGDYAPSFKLEKDKDHVIKFLDDHPYASYRLHWIERKGKKSFVCPENPDDPRSPRCPLCDAGDKTRAQHSFNIVELTDGMKPAVSSWDVGVRVLNKLKKINSDNRIGPLTEPYFVVSRTGTGTNADTTINPIKERDLWDDWNVEELTDKELAALRKKRYDKSFVDVPSPKQLADLADEFTRYDDRS
jgi:hypothetical protein